MACGMACRTSPWLLLIGAETQRYGGTWGSGVAIFGVDGSAVLVVVMICPTLCL